MNDFDPTRYIEIPEDKIEDAVRAAYDLSVPAGLGFLHARPGPLEDEVVATLVNKDRRNVVSMDYVHGRQCKFTIFQHEGVFYTDAAWYDHSFYQLVELLDRIGIEDAEAKIEAAQAVVLASHA